MLKSKVLVFAAIVTALALPVLAQQTGAPGTTAPATKGGRSGRGQNEPCWKQAGISQSVMDQHKTMQQNMHSQVEAVCADSSLSGQQKRDKIREIRKTGHEQMAALLTPEQRSQLESCRASRPHPGGARHGGRMRDPCAEFGSSKTESPAK
jgi:Spy/CpxP family protein refolding chaperone